MTAPDLARNARPTVPRKSARTRTLDGIQWTVVVLAVLSGVILPLVGAPAFLAVFALALALAFTQGVRRYGWRLLIAFFAIAFVISNFWENLSILTGFPFGDYHYTLEGRLFNVPLMIGIIYFGLGYISWTAASVLLDRADEELDPGTRRGRLNLFGLPVLAGAVMTMFDVGSDSAASTVMNAWVWEDGGGVFGVPWTNYIGWWFVTWSFFQVFALVLARAQRGRGLVGTTLDASSLAQPVIVYLALGISAVSAYIHAAGDRSNLADPAGTDWTVSSIYESMMIVTLFSVFIIGILALFKLSRGDLAQRR